MELIEVKDINIETVQDQQYDLAIFSCGYEDRCISVPSIISSAKITNFLIINFAEFKVEGNRNKNNTFFNSHFPNGNSIEIAFDDDILIYKYLNNFVINHSNDTIKILVDYSSMSRLWYVSILNWARYSNHTSITVDFTYSVGEYSQEFSPMVIEAIHAIPGHEGITTYSNTISIFGLGFDNLSTLCVLDKLEPSKIHSFVAIPIHTEYKNKAEEVNRDFIENYSEPTIYFPLNSVAKTYRMMSELIYPYIGKYNISFIPMGPKPHVLASALLSSKFDDVINLYVKGKRSTPPNVTASGKCIVTRVIFCAYGN